MTPQYYAYWHIITGLLPELLIITMAVAWTVGIAVKFMRSLASHD